MKPVPFISALMLSLACCGSALAQNETTKPSLAPAKRIQSPGSTPKPVQPAKQPGDQPKAPPAPAPGDISPEAAAAMAAMEAAGRPGEHHQHLAALVGEWDAVTRFRMAEQAPWMDSAGRSKNRMEMDGRYLVSEYAGDMGGAPFTGISTWGYDNAAKEYQATWRDSMSTSMMWLRGSCDDSGKVFTLAGDCVDPATGQRKSFRQVITIKSPDSHSMEFFDIAPDGKSYKNMEITYTRAGLIPARTKAPTPAPTQPTQNKR